MGPLWNALMCKAPRRMISFFPFYYTKVKFLCIDYWNICGRALKNLTNSVTSNKYYLRIIEEDMEDTNQHTTTIEIKAFLFHFFSTRTTATASVFTVCKEIGPLRYWTSILTQFSTPNRDG